MRWLGSKKSVKRSERAVSPVIGVMLMLVVTVLLAAAVSAFTGGLKAQKPAPTANFEVKIVRLISDIPNINKSTPASYFNTHYALCAYIEITEISGDAIPSKDLEIITYNPSAYVNLSNKYAREHQYEFRTKVIKPNVINAHDWYFNYTTYSFEPAKGVVPYLNNYKYGYWWEHPKTWFGNYTIHPGVTLTADWYENWIQAKWNGTSGTYNVAGDPNAGNVTGFCACIADGWNVTPGHYITVKIVYTPTHTVIWEKKVLVEGEGI